MQRNGEKQGEIAALSPAKEVRGAAGARVSVCLLTYNHAGVIADTVQSVLAQTLSNFELLISDDCSTDGTWEVVTKVAQRHRQVRAIRTPKNLGMCGNANFAVGQSSGEYIALLHHDDIYRPDLLERWLKIMEQYKNVGFVFNDYAPVAPMPGRGMRTDHELMGRTFPEWSAAGRFLEEELLGRWGCCVRGTAMIRRRCWDSVGGMCEEFGMLADVDLWMRLAARWDVGYVREPLISIRHARPDYYPVEYRVFSWSRLKLLYAIHAAHVGDYYGRASLRGKWKWLLYRSRVSVETCKWLAYAVVRKRADIIRESIGGECPWEWPWVRWVRNCLIRLSRAGLT